VSSPLDALAGLETVLPGNTMLGLTGNSCEDYRPEIYRWFLYQFTHKGIMHVSMNAFMIIVLGIPLEGSGGTRRMFLMFNLGVIGGAMCYMIGDGHRMVVGASGGVYALLAMHFSNLALNWHQKKFRKPTLFFLLLLLAIDLGTYLLSEETGPATVSGTAHLGGFLTGLLAGVAFGRNYDVKRYEIFVQVASLIVILTFWTSCVTWMALQEDGPRNIFEDHGWCWTRQVMDGTFGAAACVKCGTDECIDHWTTYCATHISCQGLQSVHWAACEAHGAHWLVHPGAEY
jgi:rhomboid-related protein 1/2/3